MSRVTRETPRSVPERYAILATGYRFTRRDGRSDEASFLRSDAGSLQLSTLYREGWQGLPPVPNAQTASRCATDARQALGCHQEDARGDLQGVPRELLIFRS